MNSTLKPLVSVFAAGALSFLAACGGDSDTTTAKGKDTGVATVKTDPPSDGVKADPAATNAPESKDAKGIKWAQCMRDNGVAMEDPTVDADGNLQFQPPSGGQTANMSTAFEACQALSEGLDLGGSAAQQETFSDALLAFTTCLRGEGLDVGDMDLNAGPGNGEGPQPGENPPAAGSDEFFELLIPGLDLKDPKATPALAKCKPALLELIGGGTAAAGG
jgi:hypothetical protein